MWAQLIRMSVKPDHDQDLANVLEQIHATEQPDSGLLRSITMRDQADPSQIYTLVLFESEERARAREADPRRDEGLANVRALMAELFEGPAEFTNLTVLRDA
jgi:quinol monooxygenase YgiN